AHVIPYHPARNGFAQREQSVPGMMMRVAWKIALTVSDGIVDQHDEAKLRQFAAKFLITFPRFSVFQMVADRVNHRGQPPARSVLRPVNISADEKIGTAIEEN